MPSLDLVAEPLSHWKVEKMIAILEEDEDQNDDEDDGDDDDDYDRDVDLRRQ